MNVEDFIFFYLGPLNKAYIFREVCCFQVIFSNKLFGIFVQLLVQDFVEINRAAKGSCGNNLKENM